MKVAIYCRVSTRDKEQNPLVQLEPLRRYSKDMGWEIYKEYIDKAASSDLIGRVAWTEMLNDASKHRFEVLLIWKLDRAFRSSQHASTTLTDLNSYRVGFRSYMDAAIDTTTPNGMLLFNILAAVAQFEKDLIVQRVNAGIEYAQEHGTKSGKSIGRQKSDIDDDEIFEVCEQENGNRTRTAKILTERHGFEVSPGFVSLRLKRALQKVGQKTGDFPG